MAKRLRTPCFIPPALPQGVTGRMSTSRQSLSPSERCPWRSRTGHLSTAGGQAGNVIIASSITLPRYEVSTRWSAVRAFSPYSLSEGLKRESRALAGSITHKSPTYIQMTGFPSGSELVDRYAFSTRFRKNSRQRCGEPDSQPVLSTTRTNQMHCDELCYYIHQIA
jgi:hypothetical protein